MNNDQRIQGLESWLSQLGYTGIQLHPASSDASARRYFRFQHNNRSWIAVDTPLPQAENQAFIHLDQVLHSAGLRVPTVYQSDSQNGWMLLEDFGSYTFAQALQQQKDPSALYRQASALCAEIQGAPVLKELHQTLPIYSSAMVVREVELFREWCLQSHLEIQLSHNEHADINSLSTLLAHVFSEQPQTFVHRDFHSRNLMVLDDESLGLLDFQGAVYGPLTYDWVSLLRDCYHALTEEQLQSLLKSTHERAHREGLCHHSFEEISRWFDLTGLQRHLKAIGIFCRLKQLDNKSSYMDDIPRTWGYVLSTVEKHPELVSFRRLIARHKLTERLC